MMKQYSSIISLTKNSRGIYGLDPSIGCSSGMRAEKGGCYKDCYSANAAARYGYDFTKTVLRHFKDEQHRREIVRRISKIPLDFVRMGCSGDPSEDWGHTIGICKAIEACNKQIVIITRHWTLLTSEHLEYISRANICINTTVSAIDTPDMLSRSLEQYERLKQYCKSVLRVVSFKFNPEHVMGDVYNAIQNDLFKHDGYIDTAFRPNAKNPLVVDGVIIAERVKFMNTKALVSRASKTVYLGKCSTCSEMCGINSNTVDIHPEKAKLIKQLEIFKRKIKDIH